MRLLLGTPNTWQALRQRARPVYSDHHAPKRLLLKTPTAMASVRRGHLQPKDAEMVLMTDPIRPILEREWPCLRSSSDPHPCGGPLYTDGTGVSLCPNCRLRAKFERVLGEILEPLVWLDSSQLKMHESPGRNIYEDELAVVALVALAREHAKGSES